MKTAVATGLFLALIAVSTVIGRAEQRKVFVIAIEDATDDNGFAEPGDVDSTKDIEHELNGCPLLTIAPANWRDHHELGPPLLFLSARRVVENTKGINPTYYDALETVTAVRPRSADEAPYTKLIYKVGGPGQWRYAARQVAKDLCAWVKGNATQLSAR